MYFSEELIAEIQQRNNIVDVISQYVRLQKKGNNYMCCCPFHNEKTPSFSVNPSRQIYKCFGCGEAGNVVTFLQKYENYSFPEALKALAERAGVELPKEQTTEEDKKRENRRAKLLEINKEAATFYYHLLRCDKGQIGMDYFEKRKLNEETRNRFGLGFTGVTGDGVIKHLKSKGFTEAQIRDAGLAGFSERSGLNPKFWNRVMFPIQDSNHRVIGFGGRVMGEGEPKYLNSPETEIFDKSRNLYGLNFARSARKNNMILCEGYMDVIALHQAGFQQAVASLGTAFTSGQANLLRRYVSDVLLAYDSDGAGVKAALRAIGILREVDLSAKVINMQPYKDPDEFIKNLGTEEFQKRIDDAENSFLFEIRMLERDYDLSDPDKKTRFYKEIARRLCAFNVEVERENYLEAIADKYHIGFDNLRKLVSADAIKMGDVKLIERPKSGIQSKPKAQDLAKRPQQLLMTWLADEPQLYPKIKKYISPKDFTEELYEQVATKLFAGLEEGKANPAMLISLFEDIKEQSEVASLFTAKLEEINTKAEREKAFHDIVVTVKKNSFAYYSAKAGVDLTAINQVIEGKKALEELDKTHIFLD